MAKNKNEKYIITDFKPGLKLPDYRPDTSKRMTHLLWLGDELIKGSLHVECVWIWKRSDTPGPTPHAHDFDEVLGFFGTNPADVRDLGGDLELWLEDEKYTINKSCIVFIPKGMKHCPLTWTRLDTPVLHIVVGNAGTYR